MDLPQHLFNYVSSITPLVNVELVIVCPSNSVILTWRDDGLYGPGWHLPGGVLRHKELLIDRIRLVASSECSIESFSSCSFLQINQVMNPNRDLRGHFISLVYGVTIDYIPSISQSDLRNGSMRLFSSPPDNLIKQHRRYKRLIELFMADNASSISSAGNVCSEEAV